MRLLGRRFRTRTILAILVSLAALYFLLEEFAFRATWSGPPDHGTVAGVMFAVAVATYFGPLHENGLAEPVVQDVICLSWFITCTITGLIVVNVDYNAVGNHLPAIWMHVINLVLVCLLTNAKELWIVVAPVVGLLIQVPWYRSYKLDPRSIECSGGASSFDCRHRVEYYVASGVIFVIYVASLVAAVKYNGGLVFMGW